MIYCSLNAKAFGLKNTFTYLAIHFELKLDCAKQMLNGNVNQNISQTDITIMKIIELKSSYVDLRSPPAADVELRLLEALELELWDPVGDVVKKDMKKFQTNIKGVNRRDTRPPPPCTIFFCNAPMF